MLEAQDRSGAERTMHVPRPSVRRTAVQFTVRAAPEGVLVQRIGAWEHRTWTPASHTQATTGSLGTLVKNHTLLYTTYCTLPLSRTFLPGKPPHPGDWRRSPEST